MSNKGINVSDHEAKLIAHKSILSALLAIMAENNQISKSQLKSIEDALLEIIGDLKFEWTPPSGFKDLIIEEITSILSAAKKTAK